MYDKEISALTINNIATIEGSLRVIAEVEEVLFKAISLTVKQSVEQYAKESGVAISEDQAYDFDVTNDDLNLHFGNKSWEYEKVLYAYFTLGHGEERDSRLGYRWLSHALGEYDSSARLRFIFELDSNHFNKYSGLAAQSYKKAFKDAFEAVFSGTRDFKLNSGTKDETCIYHEFHLDKEAVASAYPDLNETSEAMKPVRDAIQKIIDAHADFEALVKHIMQEES